MVLIRLFLNSMCLEVCASQQCEGQNWFSCLLYVPKYHKVKFGCYHDCFAVCQLRIKGLVAETILALGVLAARGHVVSCPVFPSCSHVHWSVRREGCTR